jgi:hypothetical protein
LLNDTLQQLRSVQGQLSSYDISNVDTVEHWKDSSPLLAFQLTVNEKRTAVQNSILALVGTCVVFAAGCATFASLRMSRLQQLFAEKWKSLEFVTNEIHRFHNDEQVVNAKNLVEGIESEYQPEIRINVDLGFLTPKELQASGLLRGGKRKEAELFAAFPGPSTFEVMISHQTLMNAFTPDGGCTWDIEQEEPQTQIHRHTYLENRITYELDTFLDHLTSFVEMQAFHDNQEFDMIEWKMLSPQIWWWCYLLIGKKGAGSTDVSTEHAVRLRARLAQYLTEYYPDLVRWLDSSETRDKIAEYCGVGSANELNDEIDKRAR